MKTGDLTNGERFVILRRRSGQSQRDAAAAHGVTLYKYQQWEADKSDPPRESVGPLQDFEVCYLRRRRAGIEAQALADELGMSRWWLCQIEYGRAPAERLVEHWQRKERPWRPGRRRKAAKVQG